MSKSQQQQPPPPKTAANSPITQPPDQSQTLVNRFRQPPGGAPAKGISTSDQKANAASHVDRSPAKQPSSQTGKLAAKAHGTPSRQAKHYPKLMAEGNANAKHRVGTNSKSAVKASDVPVRQEDATNPDSARARQPSEGASDSDAGGVAVQSGYHMSDSPLLQSTTSEGEEDVSAQPAKPTSVPERVAFMPAASTAPKSPSLVPVGKAQVTRSLAQLPGQPSTTSTLAGQSGRQPVTGQALASMHIAAAAGGAGITTPALASTSQHASTSGLSHPRDTGRGSSERPKPADKASAGQKRSAPAVSPIKSINRQLVADESSQGRHKAHKAINYNAADATPAFLPAGNLKAVKPVSKPHVPAVSPIAAANGSASHQAVQGGGATAQLGGHQTEAARSTAPIAAKSTVPDRVAFAAPVSTAAVLPPAQGQQSASGLSQRGAKTAKLPLSATSSHPLAPPSSVPDVTHMFGLVGVALDASIPKPLFSARPHSKHDTQQGATFAQATVATQPAAFAEQQPPSSARPVTARTSQLVHTSTVKQAPLGAAMEPRQSQAATSKRAAAPQAASVAEPSSPKARPAVTSALQQLSAAPQQAASVAQGAQQAAPSTLPVASSVFPRLASSLPDEPPLPSDSGEDMDIDEEEKRPLPPLPPLPPVLERSASPSLLQLATMNSHNLVAVTADEQHGLLNELSSIHVSCALTPVGSCPSWCLSFTSIVAAQSHSGFYKTLLACSVLPTVV